LPCAGDQSDGSTPAGEFQAEAAKTAGWFEECKALARHITAAEFELETLPHLNELYRTSVRLLRDRSAAEDLVQEVYLQAWKSYHKYEPGTNCRAWLYKILCHKLAHHRRRKSVEGQWLKECDQSIVANIAYAPSVAPDLTDAEVLAALAYLPVTYREVLLLADVQEFSYREVAELLRIPIGTVMSRLSRGRSQLRAALAGVARSYGIINAPRSEAMIGQI
jgi:RNA polymerase sigma-70 factor, ECF subfamily